MSQSNSTRLSSIINLFIRVNQRDTHNLISLLQILMVKLFLFQQKVHLDLFSKKDILYKHFPINQAQDFCELVLLNL